MFVLRAFAVWFVIIFAETVHGILRTLILQPLVGDFRARQIAVFSGIIIIFSISWLFVKWIGAQKKPGLLFVGGFWLVMTLGFEILLGRFVLNADWDRIFSDYDITRGGLLAFGMIFLFFAPLLAAKIRKL